MSNTIVVIGIVIGALIVLSFICWAVAARFMFKQFDKTSSRMSRDFFNDHPRRF